MDLHERAKVFSHYVGLELKGKITTRGFTAKTVALKTQHSASALNRWLNGVQELPLAVLCESCELIGVEPGPIIDAAYSRLVIEYDGPGRPGTPNDVGGPSDTEDMPAAAKKGRRKTDAESTA